MRDMSKVEDQKVYTVLIADDHAMVRELLLGLFNRNPLFQVIAEAANGIEAVEKASSLRPDLILMDINMPELNGIEATRKIRKELPGVHIIGLSIDDDEDVAFIMKKAGATALVDKAKDPYEMMEDILRSLKSRS